MVASPGSKASSRCLLYPLGMMGSVPQGGAGGGQHTQRFVRLGLHMRTRWVCRDFLSCGFLGDGRSGPSGVQFVLGT